jgi:hypothetical protein
VKSVQSVLDKWASGAQAQKYKDGIQAVDVDPMQLAVAQESALVSRFNESIASGKWRNNTLAAGAEWKTHTLAKGGQNYTTGIQAAKPKMQRFLTEFLPFADGVKRQIRGMPKGPKGGGESLARIAANMEAMMSFRRQARR